MMLKISEIFTTIQGEGPNVGKPTTFVRTGGCNLRCPGFPCDTPYAVFPTPENRAGWTKMSVEEVVERVRAEGPHHISLTGGEPLIQSPVDLEELVDALTEYTFDLFTNGSKELPSWVRFKRVTVCMDFKMPSSGEYLSFNPDNMKLLSSKDMIKFVMNIDNERDVQVAMGRLDALHEHPQTGLTVPTPYVGPVWGTNTQKLADWLVEQSDRWPMAKLNVQMHNYVYPKGVDGSSVRTNQVEVEIT